MEVERTKVLNDLQSYMERFKGGNITNAAAPAKNRPKQKNDSDNDNGIVIPPNFDHIANCVSRGDLLPQTCHRDANDYKWLRDTVSSSLPFFTREIYQPYRHEIRNEDDDDDDKTKLKLQKALSKIEELDRHLSHVELERSKTKERNEKDLDELRFDVEVKANRYRALFGVLPPGYPSTASLRASSTSKMISTPRGDSPLRFFVTDTARSCTPTTATATDTDSDCGMTLSTTHSRSVTPCDKDHDHDTPLQTEVDNTKNATTDRYDRSSRWKSIIEKNKAQQKRAGSSLLTTEEEERVMVLMQQSTAAEDEAKDGESTITTPVGWNNCCYGGKEALTQMAIIDEQLCHAGFSDLINNNDDDDDCTVMPPQPSSPRGNSHFNEVTKEQRQRRQLCAINNALRVLLLQSSSSSWEQSAIASDEEIKRVYHEAKTDFLIGEEGGGGGDGVELASESDIRVLIAGLIDRQQPKEVRKDEKEKELRFRPVVVEDGGVCCSIVA
mmetsp:Transcript_50461/g.60832  ORF Transcript_50461/g.60832 Transcript_50461/m.60832 type:complete len:498 (-) Transcript_50461:104-1597(-)|eukprot:CAMPEP_0172512630 /NCGR_PEP_ID=MMETSP1066-20121228/246086_1 /TAXON_ID=671091 /ORGANISM="Coscinodiscus wailesii, Strain CCMP2513" /LENGTH=497 /DNA_ID=CAMNT_0013292539 /DNA_START=43 /DNA_END=1536 /DNA_ORIENTATION=+